MQNKKLTYNKGKTTETDKSNSQHVLSLSYFLSSDLVEYPNTITVHHKSRFTGPIMWHHPNILHIPGTEDFYT
jgi:hypothetical protein